MIVHENRIDKQAGGLTYHTRNCFCPTKESAELIESSGTLARKLSLEFLYPSSSVNKALLSSECRVRVHSDVTHQNMVIHTINVFSLLGTGGGYGVEFFTSGYINK